MYLTTRLHVSVNTAEAVNVHASIQTLLISARLP